MRELAGQDVKHRSSWVRFAAVILCATTLVLISGAVLAPPVSAQRIENQVAVFAALDKVTARISKLEVKLGETGTFGSLKITPQVCYSRSPTEPPKTSTFVVATETQLDGKQTPLFAGWMFAESPGLNAVEHPVFDIWLTDCKGPKSEPSQQPATAAGRAVTGAPAAGDDDGGTRRRRPPR